MTTAKKSKKLKKIQIRVDNDTYMHIKTYSEKKGSTISEVLRLCISEAIKKKSKI